MSKSDVAGRFLCEHCNDVVEGLASISYKIEDEFVEDLVFLHQTCLKPHNLAKKGLTHKCPKCNGSGKSYTDVLSLWSKNDGSMELVWASQVYRKPGIYNSGKFEVIKEKNTPCDLCDGEGFLAKEPIPVITEWRKVI